MTKYIITDDNRLYKSVRTREDFAPDHKFMNKIKDDVGTIEKIFYNPVTAIAYDYVDGKASSTEFDKKDIIRALDFWINDKVLENEKLLKLHDRLEDFHETELKNLIRIKDRVMKMDNDTKFKRFIDNSTEQLRRCSVMSSDTVEFWYEIKNPPPRHNPPMISSTETMTNRTIMTGREISGGWTNHWGGPRFNFQGLGEEMVGYFTAAMNDADDEISGVMRGGRHTDFSTPGGGSLAENTTIRGGRTRRNHQAPNYDPNTWTIHRMGDNPRRWLVREPSGRTIADNFIGEQNAQLYIDQQKEHFLPSEVRSPTTEDEFHPSTLLTDLFTENTPTMRFENIYVNTVNTTISNNISVEVEFRGSNGAELTVHMIPNHDNGIHTDITMDGPHTIQLLNNSQIQIDQGIYTLTEPVRVSWDRFIPTTPMTDAEGDFIDYTDIHCHYDGSNSSWAGENGYITTRLVLTGSLVDVDMQVYVTGSEMDRVLAPFELKTLRIFNDRKDVVEINGRRIHVINMEMTFK